jgi:hypothetical protein
MENEQPTHKDDVSRVTMEDLRRWFGEKASDLWLNTFGRSMVGDGLSPDGEISKKKRKKK